MNISINRRDLLRLSACTPLLGTTAWAKAAAMNTRPIHSSGEALPVIGLGTSRTLDVDVDSDNAPALRALMQAFFDGGGTLVDTSPMYGRAEAAIGQLTDKLPGAEKMFSATKVWINGRAEGIAQMEDSMRKMGVETCDLMQIHNLVDWRTHLKTLRDWKEEGRIRYLGITTSHRRNHSEFEEIMRTEPIDFVQFSYNIENRLAEERILPLAQDKGIATLINRPYQRGSLFDRVSGKPLPPLAVELECSSWGQFFLKFILGHPAVTCLIPATNKMHHMVDNVGAGFGPIPDEKQREEMARLFNAL